MKSNLPSFEEIKEDTHIEMHEVCFPQLKQIVCRTYIERIPYDPDGIEFTDREGSMINKFKYKPKEFVYATIGMITDPKLAPCCPHKVYFGERNDLTLFYYWNKANPNRPFTKDGITYVFSVRHTPGYYLRYDGRMNVFIDQQKDKTGVLHSVFVIGEASAADLIDFATVKKV